MILPLFTVLVGARIAGSASRRLGQPAVVGALIIGILASVFGSLGVPGIEVLRQSDAVAFAATVGMFVVLLASAVEIAPTELVRSLKSGLAVASGGVLLPLIAGASAALLFFPESDRLFGLALLFGIDMSITAIPSALKVLSELGLLHAPLGRIVVAAALFDDLIGLVLVALLAAFTNVVGGSATSAIPEIFQTIFALVIFCGLTVAVGTRIFPHIRKGLKALDLAAMEVFALVSVALLYAALAELLDLHWVLGPVMAGIFFEPSRIGMRGYNEVRLALGAISDGLLAPIFFCSVGMGFQPSAFLDAPGLTALALMVAMGGKLVGAAIPARMSGLQSPEAVAVGIGMTARGAVELVVLSVAVDAGLLQPSSEQFDANLYSALIATSVISTLLAPIALRRWLRDHRADEISSLETQDSPDDKREV